MSAQYDLYLQRHKENVRKGYEWLSTNLPQLFEDKPDSSWQINFEHDHSKTNPDEYDAYDAYFYGNNRSHAVMEAFNRAWLLHIHRNPHHWQHWVLINDEEDEGKVLVEMPYNYIIEMICDWWSFSWQKGDLSEIFSWYEAHSAHMQLAPHTRKTVEDILWEMRGRLGYNTLAHQGIKGQKWGVRNGPPYPLDKSSGSGKIEDIQIGKSLGAKSLNYDVLDPASGEYFHFEEGTRIRNAQVFAGRGGSKPLAPEVADGLAEQIGGKSSNWQHCKGIGTLDYYGEQRDAEVHWFQEQSVGKHKFKIKKWED